MYSVGKKFGAIMSELKQALLQSHLCKYMDLNDLDLLITYSKTVSFPARHVCRSMRHPAKCMAIPEEMALSAAVPRRLKIRSMLRFRLRTEA